MKKFVLLLLAVVCVLALSACGGNDEIEATGDDVVQIEGNGIALDIDADAAKVLLGVYTPQQLGIEKSIEEYDIIVSGTQLNGVAGVKAEAFDPEGKKDAPAVGVFMIVDGKNYRFDAKQNKYVLIDASQEKPANTDTSKVVTVTSEDGQVVETVIETVPVTEIIPDDSSITFQYHKGNNAAMQERFAQYDLSSINLANRLTDYVFVVTGRQGVTADGTTVNVVLLYTKSGEDTGIQFGISETTDYYYKKDAFSYIALAPKAE